VPLANRHRPRSLSDSHRDGGAIIGNLALSRAVLWASAADAFVYLGQIPPGGTSSLALDLDEEGASSVAARPLSGSLLKAVLWRPTAADAVETLPVPSRAAAARRRRSSRAGSPATRKPRLGTKRGVIWRDVGGVVTFGTSCCRSGVT
jgi:hypothetical protein